MKKIHLIFVLFVILFIIQNQTSAQNWFPSEVGNEWQYKDKYWYEGSGLIIGLRHDRILEDSVFNNTRYFKFSKYNSSWLTFSEADQKLYVLVSDSNRVYMDFNISPDSSFFIFHPEEGTFEVTAREKNFSWLDTTFITKGFKGNPSSYTFLAEDFVKEFGYALYFRSTQSGSSYSENWGHLIQANINGIHYSEDYFPEITTYDSSITGSQVHLTLAVDHPHNSLFYHEFESFIYIDSVKLYSFYSKQDSVVHNPVIYADYVISSLWNCYINLNMNLLQSGFSLNYRIEAIDKGLVPRSGFAPDSGYFVYTITGVNDISNSTLSYNLYQNYPNPFNPSTNIKYQIPEISFVTLKIYDILSSEMATLINEEKYAGSYQIDFDGSGLTSGIYFYQLRADNFVDTKKMILIK